MKYAIKNGLIDKNPFDLVEMPIIKSKISLEDEDEDFENFYSREQLIQFLHCLEQDNNLKRTTLFHLLAFTGMRKSEAFALQWKDIDFESEEIRITKAVKRGESGLYLGPTKNGESRTIKADEKTMSHFKQWKSEQGKIYKAKESSKNNKRQLVFSNELNVIQDPNKTVQWLSSFLQKYDLDYITAHGLSHTHCSLLFEAGATIKEVQFRLGHKDVKTTLGVYAHVTKKAKAETIDKFTNFIHEPNHD